jgi:hypothetical protein
MPRFEVFCPAAPPHVSEDVTVRVDAEHWIAALQAALAGLGLPQALASVLCDVQADGSIHVTHPQGGSVYRVREIEA